MTTTRRTVLARAATSIAAGIAAPTILAWPANAAEFAYKYGTALPEGHPMVIRSKEAAAKIKEESGGKLDITLYPSSVLGQDTAMMSQAIAGALEIYGMSLDILAQKSPSAAIFGAGSPFPITTWRGRRWTATSATIAAAYRKRPASIAWTRRSITAFARSR